MNHPATPTRRVAVIALAMALIVAGCSRSDPERELRDTVTRMAGAIEARRPADLLEHVADDFTRESGAFGKQELQRILAGVLLRNEKIVVTAAVTDVSVQGARASARIRVLASGGSGWLPERGQTWDITTHWRREGSTWRVFNAEWQEGF